MMYGFWDMECDRQKFLSFWNDFCPFTTPPPSRHGLRKSKFWKNGKLAWRYHFTQVYHKWQWYDVWLLRYEAWVTNFFVILDHFLSFYLPNNPRNQNFEKLKKTPGDITILQKCIKNNDHMLYCSLGMAHNGFNCYF